MRGIGKCLMVVLILLAGSPFECRADNSAPPPPPPKEPVTVPQPCSLQCSSYAPNSQKYDECVASCESESSTGSPPSATVAPSAIP